MKTDEERKKSYDEGLEKIQQALSVYTEDNPGESTVTQLQLVAWADMARQNANFMMSDFLDHVVLPDPLKVPGTRFVAKWKSPDVGWSQFTVLVEQSVAGFALWTDDVYVGWDNIDVDSIQQVQPPLNIPGDES